VALAAAPRLLPAVLLCLLLLLLLLEAARSARLRVLLLLQERLLSLVGVSVKREQKLDKLVSVLLHGQLPGRASSLAGCER
jgi:hypothetical protein